MARSCAAGPEVCVIIGGDNIGSDRGMKYIYIGINLVGTT